MSPTPYDVSNAYERLVREWQTPTHLPGVSPVPPSRELFEEAVTRANARTYVAAANVASSLVAGRWPEKPPR